MSLWGLEALNTPLVPSGTRGFDCIRNKKGKAMKTAIFIDGGYIFKVIKNEFSGQLDYHKFVTEISHGKEVLRSYFYDCTPYQSNPPTTEEKERYSKVLKFHTYLKRLPRFEVRLGRLSRQSLNCKNCGNYRGKVWTKGR